MPDMQKIVGDAWKRYDKAAARSDKLLAQLQRKYGDRANWPADKAAELGRLQSSAASAYWHAEGVGPRP